MTRIAEVRARYSLESVLGTVTPANKGEEFEEHIRDAKAERSERIVSELERP